MRRMRDLAPDWYSDRIDEIARLRAGLNAAGIDGTDEQIAEAYADYSDSHFAANWMYVGSAVDVRFVKYVEVYWLAPQGAAGQTEG